MRKTDEYRSTVDPSHRSYEYHESPFYNMARLIGLYHQKVDAALKPIGVDAPRWRVLSILQQSNHATVTQISIEAVTKMSTMAKIVQRMTAEGLVATRPSEEDARSTEVFLTDKGRETLEAASRKVGAINRNSFYALTDEELRQISAICRKIHGNLSP